MSASFKSTRIDILSFQRQISRKANKIPTIYISTCGSSAVEIAIHTLFPTNAVSTPIEAKTYFAVFSPSLSSLSVMKTEKRKSSMQGRAQWWEIKLMTSVLSGLLAQGLAREVLLILHGFSELLRKPLQQQPKVQPKKQ